jgi:hypothetical protein
VARRWPISSKIEALHRYLVSMIERYRLPTEPDPPLPETQPKPRPKSPIWRQLKLNKNLCNYPVARSARTKAHWREDADGWWCRLPGEDRIELAVSADTPKEKRRVPTGFDMSVLYRLLAAEQEAAPERVRHLRFSSRAAFLRELNLTKTEKNYRRLLRSFELWSRLSIHFVQCRERNLRAPWRVPSSKDHPEGKYITKSLLPPIRQFELPGQEIVVHLHEDWIDLAKSEQYFAQVPFPLPHEATVQNLALWHLAWLTSEKLQSTELFKWRTVCRKIGLRPEKKKFKQIFERVSEWFKLRDSWGLYLLDGDECEPGSKIKSGEVAVTCERPTIPRRKSFLAASKAKFRYHKRPASLKGQCRRP